MSVKQLQEEVRYSVLDLTDERQLRILLDTIGWMKELSTPSNERIMTPTIERVPVQPIENARTVLRPQRTLEEIKAEQGPRPKMTYEELRALTVGVE